MASAVHSGTAGARECQENKQERKKAKGKLMTVNRRLAVCLLACITAGFVTNPNTAAASTVTFPASDTAMPRCG